MDTDREHEQTSHAGITALSDDTFIPEVLDSEMPVLVDFKAEWCGPCKIMGPVFAELAPEFGGRVKFAKMDVDENPTVPGALRVEGIPTFMLFYRSTVLNVGVGAMQPQALRAWIEQGLARMSDVPAEPPHQEL
jgi:thioredoxin 1